MGTQSLRQTVAAEVRAEMARQQRTGIQLAEVLNCSQQSASRRLNGGLGLSLDDLPLIADWLGVDVRDLIAPTRSRDTAGSAVA